MVKQRPGSTKGTTKQHSAVRKAHRRKARKSPHVPNKHLRDTWDATRSPALNLSAAGLEARVNAFEKPHKRKRGNVELVPVNDEVLREMVKDAGRGECVKRVVRPGERRALEGMVGRYGEDYDAMARDLRLNYLQWTPGQLRKRVERMRDILGDEVREGS